MILDNKGISTISILISISIISILLIILINTSRQIINGMILSKRNYNFIYTVKRLELEINKIIQTSDASTFNLYPKLTNLDFLANSKYLYFYNLKPLSKIKEIQSLYITDLGIQDQINNNELILGYLPYESIFGIYLDFKNELRILQISNNEIIENQPTGVKLDYLDFNLIFNKNQTFTIITKSSYNKKPFILNNHSRVIRQLPFNLLFNHE